MKNRFFMTGLAVLIFSFSGYIITGLKYSDTYNVNLRGKEEYRVFYPLSFLVAFHINNTFSVCIREGSNTILELSHIKGFFFGQKSFGEPVIILNIITHNGHNNYVILRKTQKVEITFHKDIKELPNFADVSFHPLITNVVLKKMFMYVKLKMIFAILCLFSFFICFLLILRLNHSMKHCIFLFLLFESDILIMGQQVPRALSSVDLELAGISGKASSPYAERVRLIHSLPSNLAPEQLERCRAFLESPLAGQPLPDLEFNGLKNELVFALLRQREGLTELAELLVRMSRAPDTDATWRDYCVHTRRRFAPRAAAIAAIRLSASLHSRLHFLGKCYPRINDAKSREAMADALWEALRTQRRGRAAGSAARQLMTLGRSFPEFPPGKVSAASLEALLDLASSDETKTALLQVCGTLGERGALPTARAIAGRNSAPVLRASAYPSSLRSSGRRYRGYQTIRFRFARVCHRRRRDARRRIRPAAPETPCSIGGRARLQACCCGHGQDTEVEPMNH